MAVAIIALKPWGTGWPAVFRVINSSTFQLGETFAVVRSTITGTFQEGETINFSGGGSATVVEQKASPDRVIIASMTGTISGTASGATSLATMTTVTVEGLESSPAGTTCLAQCRAVEFGGKVYALQHTTVYVLDETLGASGGRWREACRIAGFAGTLNSRLCLVVMNIGGVPHIFGMVYAVTPSVSWRIKSSDGVTWSQLNIGAVSPPQVAGNFMIANNVIYVASWQSGSNMCYSIDPATDSINNSYTSVGGFDTDNQTIALCHHRGRIFAPKRNSTGAIMLYGLTGSTFTVVHAPASPLTSTAGKTAMWTGNDGAMYMIKCSNSSGFICMRYDFGVGSYTEVSNPVLPAALRAGAGASIDGHWEVYVDNEARAHLTDNDPPDIFLWYRTNGSVGTTRSCYQFNGPSTTMTLIDSGGAPSELLLPNSQHWGGGMFSFTSGNNDVRIQGVPTPILGGERITFRIYKKPGTADVPDVKIRLLYRASTEPDNAHSPGRWGYLQNPSVGVVSVDNREITGLTADSVQGEIGGTVYEVNWLATGQDSVPNYTSVRRTLIAYL